MREFIRFVANGIFASLVHLFVLMVNVELLALSSIGWANFVASIFGITVSFLGNRFFVFRAQKNPMRKQVIRFLAIYLMIAAYHGAFLFIWSDVLALEYRLGFVFATAVQVMLSYFGNRRMVFTK